MVSELIKELIEKVFGKEARESIAESLKRLSNPCIEMIKRIKKEKC